MAPQAPLQVNVPLSDDPQRAIDSWTAGFETVNELPPPSSQIENEIDLYSHALDRGMALPPQVEAAAFNLFSPEANGPLIHPDFQTEPYANVSSTPNFGATTEISHPNRTAPNGVLIGTTRCELLNLAQSAGVSTTQVQQRPMTAHPVDEIGAQIPAPPSEESPTTNSDDLQGTATTSAVTTLGASTNSSCSGTKKRGAPTSKSQDSRRKRSRITNSKEEEAALAAASSGKADLTPEEQKRIRRVKNRASVEKCRQRQRIRFEALSTERETISKETDILRDVGNDVREKLGTILNQVAALSSGA